MQEKAIKPDIADRLRSQTTTFSKLKTAGDNIYSFESIKNFEQTKNTQITLTGRSISDKACRVLRELHSCILSGEISFEPVDLSGYFFQASLNSWGCS